MDSEVEFLVFGNGEAESLLIAGEIGVLVLLKGATADCADTKTSQ